VLEDFLWWHLGELCAAKQVRAKAPEMLADKLTQFARRLFIRKRNLKVARGQTPVFPGKHPRADAKELPETEEKRQRQRTDNGCTGAIEKVNDEIGHCEGGSASPKTINAFGECVPPSAGRVDLPATAFNQYNVSCVAAIQLFQPVGFRSDSNNGLCSKMNKELEALERKLEIRNRELTEAHRHIAVLEEKLLKLKQYRRELKLLKEERRTLRKSPERRIGQVFLAPYRVLQKPVKTVWRKLHRHKPTLGNSVAQTEYQQWFQRHRASTQELERMRVEARSFVSQPLVSILTPVFDTPVPWLREAVDSVLAQIYQNWELVLIDDGSTATDLLHALPALAARDRRIHLVTLECHQGISAALNKGLEVAKGQWLTFLDHDDVLEPDALFQNVRVLQENPELDLIYSDEDKLTEAGFDSPILKPDWSPDFFLSCNYLCHMIFLRRDLVRVVDGFRREFDGSQDYDLLLRITERTDRIHHIPRVLYHWRRSENSSASDVRQKPGQLEASWRAIEAHLKRRGEPAHVTVDWPTHAFCVRRQLLEPRKISVIIPSSHDAKSLKEFVEKLISKTSYPNYEIVIVEVGRRQRVDEADTNFRVLHFPEAANDSAAKNYAVAQTDSPWVLFLDDNVEAIDPDWLTIMGEHVQRPEVGAVGARLINRNGTIEHAGLVLGVNGIAQSAFHGFPAEHPGVNRQLRMTRNYSAVSSGCILIRREVFQKVGGFDTALPRRFADVDFCLKARCAGYLIVYTPLAKLIGAVPPSEAHDISGEAIIRQRWSDLLERDPYYNPSLSRESADFSLRK
jgi:glycosyltransferase involved in cell wall biosynthesis/transposase